MQVAAATAEQAALIARAAVERRLCAAAQIAPIRSVYRWKGQVVEAEEHLVTLITRAEAYPAVEACVRELHDYEVPEIVAVPIVAGWAPYLLWIDESTAGDAPGDRPDSDR